MKSTLLHERYCEICGKVTDQELNTVAMEVICPKCGTIEMISESAIMDVIYELEKE